jgi:hypothetical protein
MLGRHIKNIMNPVARNLDPRHIKRLRVHEPVHVIRKKFPEIVRVYIERRQNGLIRIEARAIVIVVICKDAGR